MNAMNVVAGSSANPVISRTARESAPAAYPLNQWYVAAYSDEVGRKLLGRTLLDRQVVLYRTVAGKPIALTDRCVHRKAPLSAGGLIEDAIECPFHGIRYGPDGVCLRVPCQDKVPAAAKVQSYPVIDLHGHVWIWMGDPAAAHPAKIPDMHWLTDPQLAAVKGKLFMRCNYLLALDNLLDDTHLPYVHRNSIGTPKLVTAPTNIVGDDDWVGFTRLTLDTPPSALHAKAGGFTTNVDRWFHVRYVKPSTVLIDVGSAPVGSGAPEGDRSKGIGLYSNHTVTPSSGNSCYYFWHLARNFSQDDAELSKTLEKDMISTFNEDLEIVELVQRNVDCDAEGLPQLNIAGDIVALRARRIISALVAAEAQQGKAAS
jgi:phenylpropionate dioxygenase-like ring-hydroxylating dioxygenase large terminal subunit